MFSDFHESVAEACVRVAILVAAIVLAPAYLALVAYCILSGVWDSLEIEQKDAAVIVTAGCLALWIAWSVNPFARLSVAIAMSLARGVCWLF